MVADLYLIILSVLSYPVMIALASLAGILHLLRLRFPASVRLPSHFRIAKFLGWMMLVSFYIYASATQANQVLMAAVVFSRLAILAVLTADIWAQLWILWQIGKQHG